MSKRWGFLLTALLMVCLSVMNVAAQQTRFTYQGRLTDGGAPANGNYDLQFALFDSADGGSQVGQIQTVSAVPVSAGIFTVALDFGANAFNGASRYLEVSTRPTGAGAFTLLTPRQAISSTPYAVRSLSTANADIATNAQQLAGVEAAQYVKTDDARMTDARPPTAGSSNYIQNATNPQASSNFNISGNGTAGGMLSAGLVNTATQYNINGSRAFVINGGGFPASNTFVGADAGAATIPSGNSGIGNLNSFFGNSAGAMNTSGFFNTFFGWHAGANNTAGGGNVIIGGQAGLSNTVGNSNTYVGEGADGTAALTNATAIGANARVTRDNSLVLGDNVNVGIGTSSPNSKLQVAGTVESTAGGFKFPDGSVQTSAAKIYTTGVSVGEIEILHNGQLGSISALTLPPGVYLVTATILFVNRANGLLQDNTRVVRCSIAGENIWVDRLGGQNNPMDNTTMTIHTVLTRAATGDVDLSCGNQEPTGNIFVAARRLTALRVANN
jgi:hypothetical protein